MNVRILGSCSAPCVSSWSFVWFLDVFSSQPISRFPHSCHTNDPSACTNSDWKHCFSLSSTLFTSLLLSGLLLHLFLPGWSQSAVGLERRRPLQVPSSTLPLPSSSTHCPLLPQGPAASLLTQVTLLPPTPPPSSVRGFTVGSVSVVMNGFLSLFLKIFWSSLWNLELPSVCRHLCCLGASISFVCLFFFLSSWWLKGGFPSVSHLSACARQHARLCTSCFLVMDKPSLGTRFD